MTTRATVPGTINAGDTVAETDVNNQPGGWSGYVTATSNQTGIGTSVTDLTSLTITYTFPASRRYKITGHLPLIVQNTSNGFVKVQVRDGSNNVVGTIFDTTVYAGERATVDGCTVIAPSSGSATYKLSAFTSASTFDVDCGSSPGDPGPAFLLIEDIGPA